MIPSVSQKLTPFVAIAPQATCLSQILLMDLPEPSPICHPLLFEGDLAMIHSWRGVGKTWISCSLSLAIATGTAFLGMMPVAIARRVLYCDGEMRASRLKARFEALCKGIGVEPAPGMLNVLTRDILPDGSRWPDLADELGRQDFMSIISELRPGVIVFDNLSSWVRSGGRENDEESWREVAVFLMTLRSRGISVVLIHHSGKSGAQRGTSKREDILDTVVHLRRPAEMDETEGMVCEFVYEKSRNLDAGQAQDLLVELIEAGDALTLTGKLANLDKMSRAKLLSDEGVSTPQACEELDIGRDALRRLIGRAAKKGVILRFGDGRKGKGKGK